MFYRCEACGWGVWGGAGWPNFCMLFSGFPQPVLASGLDGAGPFLALSQGLAGQESEARERLLLLLRMLA